MVIASMCEHLGRCSVPSAYNTSAGSADPLTSRPIERMKGGTQGELDLNLSRRNGKRQSGRNQATGRKLQVGQLDSRTGLGCLTLSEADLLLYRLSHRRKPRSRLCAGETSHLEHSGLTTTCGCLFGFVCKNKPTKLERFGREESSQRAPPFFCGWWEYKLD